MKLVRYGAAGAERPGMIDGTGVLRDLAAHIPEIGPAMLGPDNLARLRDLDPSRLPRVDGAPRLGPPLSGIGKIIGIGLNYADHAAEAGLDPPKEPIVFLKATTALSGPNDPIVIPRGSAKTDWEAELALVIGTPARYVERADALAHIAGYLVCNDVSERNFQLERGGQWTKGKSSDSFAPLGPWLVSAEEIPDPQALDLWLDLNGEPMQRGNTRTMIFGVVELVSYVSQFMTLMPGDVITTGTPPGVGSARKPPRYLRGGDVLKLGVAGLGEQRQEVKEWRAG